MRVAIFQNSLGLGGTEKAAAEWAQLLSKRPGITEIRVVALSDGPRRSDLQRAGIQVQVVKCGDNSGVLLKALGNCDVVHAHVPGFPHPGDALGAALRSTARKIPVVQTNIFGKLENSLENEWTDFRLFISWTSCVQAARRSGRKLDREFFRKQSVAVYPVANPALHLDLDRARNTAVGLRRSLGISEDHILFGRFSRPEPNKWAPLALDAFLSAYKRNPRIRLLLREPPANVASDLRGRGLAAWGDESAAIVSHPIIFLRGTSDAHELAASQLACDAILHTSKIGESFGYGIAEPMALGRPIITHSVPWHDQAQLELVHHGECGLTASSHRTMTDAILRLAADKGMRISYGDQARERILQLADSTDSAAKLETALRCAVEGRDNPDTEEDLLASTKAASDLDRHQWGHSLDEFCCLRSRSAKIGFLRWQRLFRNRFVKRQSVTT